MRKATLLLAQVSRETAIARDCLFHVKPMLSSVRSRNWRWNAVGRVPSCIALDTVGRVVWFRVAPEPSLCAGIWPRMSIHHVSLGRIHDNGHFDARATARRDRAISTHKCDSANIVLQTSLEDDVGAKRRFRQSANNRKRRQQTAARDLPAAKPRARMVQPRQGPEEATGAVGHIGDPPDFRPTSKRYTRRTSQRSVRRVCRSTSDRRNRGVGVGSRAPRAGRTGRRRRPKPDAAAENGHSAAVEPMRPRQVDAKRGTWPNSSRSTSEDPKPAQD